MFNAVKLLAASMLLAAITVTSGCATKGQADIPSPGNCPKCQAELTNMPVTVAKVRELMCKECEKTIRVSPQAPIGMRDFISPEANRANVCISCQTMVGTCSACRKAAQTNP